MHKPNGVVRVESALGRGVQRLLALIREHPVASTTLAFGSGLTIGAFAGALAADR